jgi:nucleoside-diphosphate-sugar epimerase
MNILITGARGYLGSSIIEGLSGHDIIEFSGDVRYVKTFEKIDMVYHFAGPSDRCDFKDKYKTTTTIIDGTINMVRLTKEHDATLVFASTMGVHTYDINDMYCSCKRAMEHYIQSNLKKYYILRIPRVYSKCRQKGLMKQLRNDTVPDRDMNKSVQFLPLDLFVNQTNMIINNGSFGVYEYTDLITDTIGGIKKRYEL